MKSVVFFLLLFSIKFSFGQEISEALVIDGDVNFCKPGVLNKSPGKGLLLEYRYQPNFTFNNNQVPKSTVDNNIRFNSKIKIPVIIKPSLKVLIGFRYMIEKYNFDDDDVNNYPLFSTIDGESLKTSGAAVYVSKSLNDRFYTSFRLGFTHSGDYNRFSTSQSRYATYRAVGVFGIKKREDFEYGFGVMFSKSFRNTTVLPFGFLNKTYNNKWGIELGIPVSLKVRRDFSDGSLLLFGPQFNSRNYSLDVANADSGSFDIVHFRRAGVETSVTYQQRLKGWIWMQATVGYMANLKADVENQTTNVDAQLKQSNSLYGSIGIFLSPPSKNRVCEDADKK